MLPCMAMTFIATNGTIQTFAPLAVQQRRSVHNSPFTQQQQQRQQICWNESRNANPQERYLACNEFWVIHALCNAPDEQAIHIPRSGNQFSGLAGLKFCAKGEVSSKKAKHLAFT